MPVLARRIEEAGISTVLITNMPYWAERIGTPRVLAVEHPFGCPLGFPGDLNGQLAILKAALSLLETCQTPGSIQDYPDHWPVPVNEAIKLWQPPEPSPIIRLLTPRIRELIRHQGRNKP